MRSMGKANKGILLVLTVLLVSMMSAVAVYALTVPDLDAEGSITVTMTDPTTKKTVGGGSLLLYKVGEVYVEDANYSWVLSEDFAESGADLSDLKSEDLTATLVEYAENNSITPSGDAEIDDDGQAEFENLNVGLYLITQDETAVGYQAVMPFLVTIPMKDGEDWIYDVDASPKVEALLTGTPTPTPTATVTPTPTTTVTPTPKNTATPTPRSTITPRATITPRTKVTTAAKTTLPKTGQLWWPVPILAVVGIVFVFVGFRRRSR